MSSEPLPIEGDTLEDALLAASKALGVPREGVAFKYDRDHLAAGASTVRIFATKKSAEVMAAEAAAPRPVESAPPPPRERRDDRGFDRDRRGGDRGPPRGDRGDRGPPRGDRGPPRGDRGDRGARPPRRDPEADRLRDEELQNKARDLVAKVKAGEGMQQMENLNSYERHKVHTVVAEAGLASVSVGEELRKTVQISLKVE